MQDEKRTEGRVGIFVLRHGTTPMNKGVDNKLDKIRGWINIGLNEEGRKEAHKVGQTLKHYPIERIISSDLDRALETAKIIGGELGLPVSEKSKDYRPWFLGVFQNQNEAQVRDQIAGYITDTPDKAVPEGESFNTFAKRFTTAMRKLMQQHKDGTLEPTVIVTHYRDIKLLQAWLKTNGDRKAFCNMLLSDDIQPAAIIRVFPVAKGWDLEILSHGG